MHGIRATGPSEAPGVNRHISSNKGAISTIYGTYPAANSTVCPGNLRHQQPTSHRMQFRTKLP